MNENTEPTKRLYKVEIGHSSVVVESATADDAIRAARTKLSLEMPRLWDIIHMDCLATEFTSQVLGAVFAPDPVRSS